MRCVFLKKRNRMELYLDPPFANVPKQRKPHPLKGKHQWATNDPVKRERMLRGLRAGWEDNKKGLKNKGKPSVHRVPVSVYDMDGNFVAVCRHIHEAAERFGTNPYNVSACIHGRRRTAGNHQFRKAKVEEFRGMQLVRKSPIEKITGRLSYKRAVAVYDLDGAYLGLCESVARAAREYGVSEAGIKQCLSGRSKRSGLYQFRDAYAGIDEERTPISPYLRTYRKKNQDPYTTIKDKGMRNFIANYKTSQI